MIRVFGSALSWSRATSLTLAAAAAGGAVAVTDAAVLQHPKNLCQRCRVTSE
ncbi:hypothetical protein QSH18_14785 [Xanthomonas sp. NCPPB 2654]|uniref:hypothetical protein n=1 Tax=unclassified Xanthomonas TaxID=2643310 RepID=UPI0021E05EF4|nr:MULTISPECIES: hypothetical protein [unclassified Xanthomonas]MDL5366873.1 hypothetical protein [Xanthomonas sp. NCPPB 2654]UYC19952.1 hypothetical protein NUG20_17535 [Xanthomonas sp. CFBP 8443]